MYSMCAVGGYEDMTEFIKEIFKTLHSGVVRVWHTSMSK